jgi:hypothetical protein
MDERTARRTCPFFQELGVPIAEMGDFYPHNSGFSEGGMAPFRVVDDTLEFMFNQSVLRCSIVPDGTDGQVLARVTYEGGKPGFSPSLQEYGILTADGFWMSPRRRLHFDGTSLSPLWMGFNVGQYPIVRKKDRTGFIVPAIEDATGDIVVFEQDLSGARQERYRTPPLPSAVIPGAHITDEFMTTIVNDACSVRFFSDGAVVPAAPEVCASGPQYITADRTAYVAGTTWGTLDGSASVTHDADTFVTAFETAVYWQISPEQFSYWFYPADQEFRPEGVRHDIEFAGAEPHFVNTLDTTPVISAHDNGLCAINVYSHEAGVRLGIALRCDSPTGDGAPEVVFPRGSSATALNSLGAAVLRASFGVEQPVLTPTPGRQVAGILHAPILRVFRDVALPSDVPYEVIYENLDWYAVTDSFELVPVRSATMIAAPLRNIWSFEKTLGVNLTGTVYAIDGPF